MAKKSFSLIELIFVISVLGIIASFAVPKFFESRSGAIVTTIKQDISTITTAIQAHYMLDSKIKKITDTVNINEQNWKIEDKKVEYITEEKVCVTISLESNSLKVNIKQEVSQICQKLYDAGIRDITYELI